MPYNKVQMECGLAWYSNVCVLFNRANTSLTDYRLKIIFGSTPTWLRAPLTSCRFKAPHYTCTNCQTV